MDQHDRSQRQQARQTYGQQHVEGGGSAQNPSAPAGSNEGFRQPEFIQQSPVSASVVGRTDSNPGNVYGVATSPQYGPGIGMQPSSIHYGQVINSAEAARQQSQQYQQYGSSLIYGMATPQGAQVIPSSYEQVPPHRHRPGSGSETMGATFGVAQYYELSAQNVPARYQQPETYPVTGPASVHPFPTSAMDPSQTMPYIPYTQQPPHTSQLQVPSEESPFEHYQWQIRNIFTLARDGALRDVGAHLLEVSQYLLGNVEALGLTRDDETLHEGRIRLWDEFNRAWLVSLQEQLDLSQQTMSARRSQEGIQSMMDAPMLERLSSELVRLCDSVEKHGLVDYQMGVAEEEIIELLLRCQSVLNSGTERTTEITSETSRGAGSRRR